MAIKVGTEDKKKVYLASGLGLVMLILLVRFLWQNFGPSPSPAPASPPAVVTTARPATTPSGSEQENSSAGAYAHPAAKVGGLAALDPTLHPEIMGRRFIWRPGMAVEASSSRSSAGSLSA